MSRKPSSLLFGLLAPAWGLSVLALLAGAPAQAQQPGSSYYVPPGAPSVSPPAQDPRHNPYLIYLGPPPPVILLVPPPAASPPPPAPSPPAPSPLPGSSLADLGKTLNNYFTPEEQELLVDYMKESVLAAFKGEEVSLPPDLAFKLEILLQRMKKEGSLYMDNLMKQLESDLKRSLKDGFSLPGTPAPERAPAQPLTAPASTTPLPAVPTPGSRLPGHSARRVS